MNTSYITLAILAGIVCISGYASTKPLARHSTSVLTLLTQMQATRAGVGASQSRSVITPRKIRPSVSRSARPAPDGAVPSVRADVPVVAVTSVGPGQAGYVHYFVVKLPSGEDETLVGIELPDQRIIWAFPELGVVVTPFIKAGAVHVNGKDYDVQYLYGLRPFPDDESMRRLQAELINRVTLWAEDATPYCNLQGPPSDQFCMSCLGLALRILFPGPTPKYPVVPRDFPRSSRDTYYTTEDLLVYLVGLHALHDKAARLKRIDELALPGDLRDDVVRIVNANAENEKVAVTEATQAWAAKKRPGGLRFAPKKTPQRLPPPKRASS